MTEGKITPTKFPLFHRYTGTLPIGPISSAHGHNDMEIAYVTSGNVALLIEDSTYVLRPGTLYIVRPTRYHYLEVLTTDPYDRYILHLDPTLFDMSALDAPELLEVFNLPKNSLVAGLFSRFEYYRNNLTEEEFKRLYPHLVEELLVNLKLSVSCSLQNTTPISPILTRAMEYINSNLFSITKIEEVAQALFISNNYLFYLFRTALHCSPKRYITEKRLLAAQQLIREGHKPSSVYTTCGFRYYSTFHHGYCSYFGHPPSQDYPESNR